MKNQLTGRSRGFGFVTFEDDALLDKVMADKPHIIDNRQVSGYFLSVCIKSMLIQGSQFQTEQPEIYSPQLGTYYFNSTN